MCGVYHLNGFFQPNLTMPRASVKLWNNVAVFLKQSSDDNFWSAGGDSDRKSSSQEGQAPARTERTVRDCRGVFVAACDQNHGIGGCAESHIPPLMEPGTAGTTVALEPWSAAGCSVPPP